MARNTGSDFNQGISQASAAASGSGTVTGSSPVVDNGVARWHGTDGTALQGSTATINDAGTLIISGSDFAQRLEIGKLSATASIPVYGMAVTSSFSSSLGLYGTKESSASGSAVHIMAALDADVIDSDYAILLTGWLNRSGVVSPAWLHKEHEIESYESASAEILGTDPDGAAAIGTIVGSNVEYTSDGARLLSIQNSGDEKGYTDLYGQNVFCVSKNGGATREGYFSDYVSAGSGSAWTYSTNQIPAGAMVYATTVYFIESWQTGSECWVGVSASAGFTEYWAGSVHPSASVNNLTSSQKSGWTHFASAAPVAISSSVWQGAATTTGSVRIECRYREVVPPTS